MMARLVKALSALPSRQLHMIGGGMLLVLAAALWMYGLRAPLTQLRAVRAEQQRLETGGADPRLLAAQLAQLDADIEQLSARLGLGTAHPAPAKMLLTLIGDVNRLALAHGIAVNAVTPSQDVQTMVFDQVGFELDAGGSYTSLLAWMAAIEATQPNIAIASFDMEPAKTAGQIHVRIRIAAYRPQKDAV